MTAELSDGPSLPMPHATALLDRCRAGDDAAWRELFDQHFAFVRRTSRHLGTPDAELDDVCQEVFLAVFRALGSFTHGRFTTWLYRIAANVTSHRHRRRRFRRALQALLGSEPEPAAPRGPDAALERRETRAVVSRVLEQMAPKKREVFALYELDGLTGAEIAERLGCPVETVRTRLFHARKEFERLARKLGLAKGGGG